MDFESSLKNFQDTGPHPGLSPWLNDTILLYRCRDITEPEFRQRLLDMAAKLEELLNRALPENLEPETYRMASEFYDAAADCLETYLAGIEETLAWADTGHSSTLDAARRFFTQGDQDWNDTIKEAVSLEQQFAELDRALLKSLGINPEG